MIRRWVLRPLAFLIGAVLCLNPTLIRAQIACCVSLPDYESTEVIGTDPQNATVTAFNQVIGSDNYTGISVQEVTGQGGTDSCYWEGSSLSHATNVGDGIWTVGSGDTLAYNNWGWDYNGWDSLAVLYIQNYGLLHYGVPNPCASIAYQDMQICQLDWSTYGTNVLTSEVSSAEVQNCRQEMGHSYAVCQAIGFHP